MALHLIKLAVGIRDMEHLAEVQTGRRFEREGRTVVPGFTRRMPRRPDEIVDGGSIYWVIKGSVRCRQRILDFEQMQGEDGQSWCRLVLDPDLVTVMPVAKKAFQGWRYLSETEAPRDLEAGQGDELPPHLVAELRELGLL
jgi:hypothetical protein